LANAELFIHLGIGGTLILKFSALRPCRVAGWIRRAAPGSQAAEIFEQLVEESRRAAFGCAALRRCVKFHFGPEGQLACASN
jgi:hypothetical protein